MRNLISTTTGAFSSQIIVDHCGDYAGKFQDEAWKIFYKCVEANLDFKTNEWADIMFDRKGNVYAVWAEDALTCQNATLLYYILDREDCPEAFSAMEEKIAN